MRVRRQTDRGDRKRGGSDRPLPYLSLSLTRKATKPFPNPESNTSLPLTRKATQAFPLHGKQSKPLPNPESKPSLSLTRKAIQVSHLHGKQPISLPNQDCSASLSLNRKAIQVSLNTEDNTDLSPTRKANRPLPSPENNKQVFLLPRK